jgi:hypothetical protein
MLYDINKVQQELTKTFWLLIKYVDYTCYMMSKIIKLKLD